MKLVCWSACLGLLLLGGGQIFDNTPPVFDNTPPATQPAGRYSGNLKPATCLVRIAEIDAALGDLSRPGVPAAKFESDRFRLLNMRAFWCGQLTAMGLAAPPLPANCPAASQSAEEKAIIVNLKMRLDEADKFIDEEQTRTPAGAANGRLEGLLTRREGLANQLARLGVPQPARKDVGRPAPIALAVPTIRPVLSRPNVPLLWDGKETVADYARRNKIADVELTAKLGTLQVQRQAVPVIMKLTLIPAGTYLMGPGQVKSDPEHQVTISKPFYMTVYPVTSEQYVLLMGLDGTPPLREPRRKDIGLLGRRPYKDAVEFCARLSKVAGRTCRFPTEAEWEFACRAGTSTRFFFGDAEKDLPRYTWLYKDIMSRDVNDPLPPVGQKLPNPWGLYDLFLCGEWCSDWGADYPKPVPDSQGNLPAGGLIDPKGPNTGTERVIRGEQWSLEDQRAPGVVGFGSRFRGRGEPVVPFAFRVVMEIK